MVIEGNIGNFISFVKGTLTPQRAIYLIGDVVRYGGIYGAVVHPQELEKALHITISYPKSLWDGKEVCLELSNGIYTRVPIGKLTKVDPYKALEQIVDMYRSGVLSESNFFATKSFLERVAEGAFEFKAQRKVPDQN